MPSANNPFKPTSPVYKNVFAGRGAEIIRIDKALVEASNGSPTNLMIVGERGLGKTSLLLFLYHHSGDSVSIVDDKTKFHFLPIFFQLDHRTDIRQFARKFSELLDRGLKSAGSILPFLKGLWEFIQRIEIANSKLGEKPALSESEVIDNLIHSIIDTIKLIKSSDNPYDGIVVLIDEADNAPPELDLGSLLKQLSERLVLEGNNYVFFVLAGLPEVRELLFKSHPSSLRLFEELELLPLAGEDIKRVVMKGLEQANQKNEIEIKITDEALNNIVSYSEGYPHFVQQFAYSAYETDNDNIIDTEDVEKAAFSTGGALDLIGDRYYKKLYFSIKEESYRQILKIMSVRWNQWISKREIREKFKGKQSTLDNAIQALIKKKIILPRPDKKGEYRLQWFGFALWIRVYAEKYESNTKKYDGIGSHD